MNTNRLEKNYSINFIKEKVLDKKIIVICFIRIV